MKRKYDKRNKRNFILILILSILIIGIFSLFIYKYLKAANIIYNMAAGTVIQDSDKNYIEIDTDADLKQKWNGNYYLVYNDEKIDFGKKVISYNPVTGVMKLYGTFYEIGEDGKVITQNDETVLSNTSNCKFYKLDDREYLLVDTKIYDEDRKIEANNYLLVELDKLGNAKLSNDKLNLKTISETTLLTSKYNFDINNESLYFSKDGINLKKIIGSTNEYIAPEEKDISDKKNDDKENNTDRTNTGIGTGNGSSNGLGKVVNNKTLSDDIVSIEELLQKIKMTSVIRIIEGLTEIDVDYVVYDPYNEYISVYVEVIGNGKATIVNLDKNETHVTLDKLLADNDYVLNFIYTTLDQEKGEIILNTFDSYSLHTLKPQYNISIYKVSTVNNTLTYKVNLLDNFNVSSINTLISFDYDEIDLETGKTIHKKANINDTIKSITGKSILRDIPIDGYNIDRDTVIKLTLVSVNAGDGIIPINESYSFRFGR